MKRRLKMSPCVEQADSTGSNPVAFGREGSTPSGDTRVVHCKKERFDVYVGRPSEWGNPFSHRMGTLAEVKVDSVEEAIAAFELWVREQPALIARIKRELKGKVLGCWCFPKPCHANVLATIAEEP